MDAGGCNKKTGGGMRGCCGWLLPTTGIAETFGNKVGALRMVLAHAAIMLTRGLRRRGRNRYSDRPVLPTGTGVHLTARIFVTGVSALDHLAVRNRARRDPQQKKGKIHP